MKIMSNQPGTPIRTFGKPAAAEKQPWQMDQFKLQQEIWDADRQVAQMRQTISSGHSIAVAGLGVLCTSLGIMAAQSILSGGLPGMQMIPAAVGAATGVTLLTVGASKRDNAQMEIGSAHFKSELLQSIYDKRFP